MHRIPGRILLITAAFALFLVPIAAIAAGGFDDVSDGNVFKADIQWLADAGVTKGCNPPANTKFCPEDNVTREQMAAFMHRLAINKIVDAKTAMDADKLDGKDSTAFLGKTDKAADADKLDGKDSTAFLGKTDKAADADKLDSKDSTAFVQKGESDSIDAIMTTNEAGIAFAFDAVGGTATSALETFMSITIVAPTNGYVVVEGSVELRLASGQSGNYFISAVPNDVDASGSDGPIKGVSNPAPTVVYMIATEEKAYPVSAGSHTYYMGLNGLSGVAWDDATIVAIFYPTAYGNVSDPIVAGASIQSGDSLE